MLKDFCVLLVIASVKIVTSENLPEVVVPPPERLLPQNPPQLPRIYLSGQKFSLPYCCNASEWDDVDLSLKVLADDTEPEPERSFASLVNLIKFILIKEELSSLNATTEQQPVQVKRSEEKILDNSQISNKIETALANKPKHKAPPIEFYDSIDITNMIPIWRPRGNIRKKSRTTQIETKSNCTCNAGPTVLQNLGPGLTVIGSSLNPIKSTVKTGCPCSKHQTLTLNLPNPGCPKCQTLPSTNIKPVVIGCGGNCNICQKLTNPMMSACPKLASSTVLSGCPKTNLVVSGCPCSKPILGCPGDILAGTKTVIGCPGDILAGTKTLIGCPGCNSCAGGIPACPCQAKQSLTVLQSESVPLMNCFGNFMKQVTTTVLVPYTVSQCVA